MILDPLPTKIGCSEFITDVSGQPLSHIFGDQESKWFWILYPPR